MPAPVTSLLLRHNIHPGRIPRFLGPPWVFLRPSLATAFMKLFEALPSACPLLALFLASALPAHAQITSLVETGDVLPGVGTVALVGEFDINATGDWVAVLTSDLFPSTAQAALVRNGQLVPFATGPGLSAFWRLGNHNLDIDDAGNIAWMNTGSGVAAMMVNQTEYFRYGQDLLLAGMPSGATVSEVRCSLLAGDNSGALYSVVRFDDAPNKYRQLIRSIPDAAGVVTHQIVYGAGTVLPGGGAVGPFSYLYPEFSHQMDSGAQGDLLVNIFNLGVFRFDPISGALQAIALPTDPAPFLGTQYAFVGQSGCVAADDGTAYYPVDFASSPFDYPVVMADQQIALLPEQGFPSSLLPGHDFLGMRVNFPLRQSASGDLLYSAQLFDKDQQQWKTGLMLGLLPIVVEGTTTIDGAQLGTTQTPEASYEIDPAGEVITFWSELDTGKQGVYQVRPFASATTVPGCTPKTAALLSAQAWKLGGAIGAATLEGGPASALGSLVLISATGSTGCGTLIAGGIEVLIDLNPAPLLALSPLFTFPSATGLGALYSLPPVPNKLGLLGTRLHGQGFWIDPLSPVQTFRESNALVWNLGF